MNPFLDLTRAQFEAFKEWPIDGAFQMLNLLKFKETVEGSELSGRAQYRKYMEAASPFITQANGKVLFYGRPLLTLIGPTELEWDKVLIVEYASKSDFIGMITKPGYPAHLRKAALEDSRLILCQP
ncbi:MAG: DUF1330 domain-containing protein [Bacteroidota bacterium]